jgi:hypothetical protein
VTYSKSPLYASPRSIAADANGNGVVNQAEVLCIGLNWQKTHATPPPIVAAKTVSLDASAAPPIKAVVSDAPASEGEVEVAIVVGDSANPVVNLFGVSFVMRYDPAQLRVPLPFNASIMPGDFLGGNLPIFFANVDSIAGRVSIGMSRAGVPQGASGAGALALIRFRAAATSITGTNTEIDIVEVAANDPNGSPIELAALGASIVVSIERGLAMPTQFALRQNYPNPFNPQTAIAYSLPQEGNVRLVIYNMLGQMVRKLVDENQAAGHKRILWDGNNEFGVRVSSGVYFYRIEFGKQKLIGKMILQQ